MKLKTWVCGAVLMVAVAAIAWEQTQQDLNSYSGSLIAQWKQGYLSGTFAAKPTVPLQYGDVPAADQFILSVFDHLEKQLHIATIIAVEYEQRYAALDPYFQDTNQAQTQADLRDRIDSFLAALGLVDLELDNARFERDEAIIKLSNNDIDGGLAQLSTVLVWAEEILEVNPDGSMANAALQSLLNDGYSVEDLLRDREANATLQDAYEQAGASI